MLKIKEDKMQQLEKFGFKKRYSTYKFSADGKYNNRATLSISGCKQSTRDTNFVGSFDLIVGVDEKEYNVEII